MEYTRNSSNGKTKNFLIVGAIDFGTSYSGYAYSYNYEPNRVYTQHWNSATRGVAVEKIPTRILFDKNKNFKAFGFKAEEEYGIHCEEGNGCEWYFFQGYKLALYEEMHIRQNKMITDEQGRQFSLFKIITETIRYLNKELMENCKKRQDKFKESDLLRVITVPAIWSDSARYFMKNAAEAAGIPEELLNICLEPEAAAIYCRTVPCKTDIGGINSQLLNLSPGQKYLVLDAGGGTVDIVVHEVEEFGRLKEHHPACGGDWGGTMVDKAFIDFVEQCLGKEVFAKFRQTENYDFMDFMREFENKKRSLEVQNDVATSLLFRVPVSLQTIYQASQSDRNSPGADSLMKGNMQLKGDKMKISYGRIISFFDHSKEQIGNKLDELFANDSLKDVETIIMAGGYSDCLILQQFIIEKFKSKMVIIPNDSSTAVLQGAVMFGHDPSVVGERRCRYTYGIKTCKPFDTAVDKKTKRFVDEDGIIRAKDRFDIHVKVGQNVKAGVFQQSIIYQPLYKKQNTITLELFACSKLNPLYVDEDECKRLNSRSVDISDLSGTKSSRAIEVSLCFGGPMITVKALKKQTGEEMTNKIRYEWRPDQDLKMKICSVAGNDSMPMLSCALHLGTSSCTYLLSIVDRLVSPIWRSAFGVSQNLPTCILFDVNHKFTSFGFEAEDLYAKYTEEGRAMDWHFIRGFISALSDDKDVCLNTVVMDSHGRRFPLIKAVSVVSETRHY